MGILSENRRKSVNGTLPGVSLPPTDLNAPAGFCRAYRGIVEAMEDGKMQSKYVLERVSAMTVEEAEAWRVSLEKFIAKRHSHIDAGMRRWQDRYYDLLFNRYYSPEPMYTILKEVDLLRDLNHKQAARIMELEHDLRMSRRNHE